MPDNRKTSEFLACRACVCSALRQASRAVTRHFEQSFRGTGLRATQFSLLSTLAQTGPIPVSALAKKLAIERTTVTRNIRPLLDRKLLALKYTDADQRIHKIDLTPAGRAAARKALSSWRQAQSRVGPILQQLKLNEVLSAK